MNPTNQLSGYKIELSSRAKKVLKKLDSGTQKDVIEKLEDLVKPTCNLDIKKLEGYKNWYRIKWGNYRIVYEPLHDVVLVYIVLIGHRKDVYKELSR